MNPCPEIIHHWWQWHLSVGVAIGLLAGIGVIVPWFRGNARRTEKAIWTLLRFIFVFEEIWAIHQSQVEHDEEQHQSWCLQEQRFQQIANKADQATDTAKVGVDKMKHLVSSAQHISSTTQEALNQLTGNGEYCFLSARRVVGRDEHGKLLVEVMVANPGPLPLDVCHVRVRYDGLVMSVEDEKRMFVAIADEQLGPMPPGKIPGKKGYRGQMTNIVLPEGDYWVNIETRNDRFYEALKIDAAANGVTVTNSIKVQNDRGKVVYREP